MGGRAGRQVGMVWLEWGGTTSGVASPPAGKSLQVSDPASVSACRQAAYSTEGTGQRSTTHAHNTHYSHAVLVLHDAARHCHSCRP